jgi:hypothetical protein
MTSGLLALGLWVVAAQGQVSLTGSDDLAAARALYASGDYETALTRLAAARTDATADEVDQYRALCLLALGRNSETEQSLRELVDRRPHYRLSEEDVSPRLVTMFHAVRKQLLPGIVKALYAKSRRTFDEKRYAEAASGLRDTLDLLADPDVGAAAESMSDIKVLAESFLKLADVEVANAKAAETAAAAAAAARAKEAAVPPPSPATPTIYSDNDSSVNPPVAVVRTLPPWRPPNAAFATRSYQGHLRVVIDETGRVESATLLRPFLPGYDIDVVEWAKKWQFRPATRAGVPVKFVRIFTIDVSAR